MELPELESRTSSAWIHRFVIVAFGIGVLVGFIAAHIHPHVPL